MPLSHSHSFASLSGLLTPSQTPSVKPARMGRPPTPHKPLPITPDPSISTSAHDEDQEPQREDQSQTASSLLSTSTSVSKRTHALQELLSSERAYASDLALIRDIHIPLALGQPPPFNAAPPTPPPSGPSSCTESLRSDASSISSCGSINGPAMTPEDARIIFNNVAELAAFADTFTEKIEEALGSVLELGTGEDHVGALFLENIPILEPLYLPYITKHPTALEHLNSLPETPALKEYLAQSHNLASNLTHAWDLPSLLIKPVQRLLKYPLLLSAIIDETPESHPDIAKLKLAREKMEEVARTVNEERRRREVIKEVLSGVPSGPQIKRNSDPKPKPKKKGLNVGISASVSLGRMKTLSQRSFKVKEGSEADKEAEQVMQLGHEVKRHESYARNFAKQAVEWCRAVEILMQHLRAWSTSFGQAIGVTQPGESEAYDAFMGVVTHEIPSLCKDIMEIVKERLLGELAKLVDSTLAPLRLLEAMQTLEPLHAELLNLKVSKARPPPHLVEASQYYVALRAQLAAELPPYIGLLSKGITLCILQFSNWQANFWGSVRDRWLLLWNALKVEGEMNAGAAETLRVWWMRFGDVEVHMLGLNILRQPEKKSHGHDAARTKSDGSAQAFEDDLSENGSTVIVMTSFDPFNDTPSSPSSLSLQTPVSNKARSVRSVDLGALGSRRGLERQNSDGSQRSKKSTKSFKSGKSGHDASHSANSVDPKVIAFGYTATLTSLGSSPQKATYLRQRIKPIPAPLPLKKSYSQSRIIDRHANTPQNGNNEKGDWRPPDSERGRPSRKPSFKRRLTEALKPDTASLYSRQHRSPSMPATGLLSPMPSPIKPTFTKPSVLSRRASRGPSISGDQLEVLYSCQVVHPCEPPPGVSYQDLPFFTLHVGDVYDVLKEAGHPSIHQDLPLYVDDGEDCLLLVRNCAHDVGWVLASFLVPAD
ncbi:uncharacterized protein LAESUDRAFT_663896 [Laetiporus sulphureus 93-53]|uniref:DH domain-containing protein n=1 Tax=Laetiporus sulphureus 93-53 TaxID=1314785 RepID=A0A165BQV5_9APHY|nr:uncharacterized protein LAESUDRAFT_663896 [Laetiporus sulphureus 93-53]KZT01488.1 hypothetical protein LAESUDRAFT_663896 [Laetiporus sulphureus 93-53]